VAHSSAGYLLFTAITHKYIFDYRPGDVYACVADCGWITGEGKELSLYRQPTRRQSLC